MDPRLNLSNLNLSGADISGAYFLVGSKIGYRHGDLRGADLRGTDLRGSTFEMLWLRGADFRGADLRGADLTDASLYDGCCMYNVTPDPSPRGFPPEPDERPGIEDAKFADALADSETTWPDGFDWRATGVRLP
jgi:uncharacterized protein YjbI with pentapeptide repeats